MKNKFFVFSLFIFGLLIFIGYPQISFAATASVATGNFLKGVGLTNATASSTVTSTGDDAVVGGTGFVVGTATGVYTATSSRFANNYATGTAFQWSITETGTGNSSTTNVTLSKGTVYYIKAYASTSAGSVYSSTESSFLTGVDVPTSVTSQSTEDSIKLMWTAGTGSSKTQIRYNDGSDYPTATSSGTTGDLVSTAFKTFTGLPKEHTYYFSLWASTTASGLSTTSDSYATFKAATTAVIAGGVTRVTPTTYTDSLVIKAGAATTKTRDVTLTLRAGDASLMTVCDRSDLLNCPLESYATSKSWTLPEGDGVKTVYAKFVSQDGINSALVSDTITLDTSVPAPAIPAIPAIPATPAVPAEEPAVPATPATPAAPAAPAAKPISEMTKEELTVKVAEILAQIQTLQAELTKLKVAVAFEVNLKYGDRGDDVAKLQEALIKEGLLSEGLNTGWFGPATKASVIKFQEKYASEILSPSRLAKGTGFVGPSTRAKLNELSGK